MAWIPCQNMQCSEEDPIRKMAAYVNSDTIRFDIGEPDICPPQHINEAIKKAMDEGRIKYSPTGGIKRLKELTAEYYSGLFEKTVKPNQVVMTNGATEAISSTIAAHVEPGDKVLYPNPHFPKYVSFIKDARAIPIPINIRTKTKQLDIFTLKLTELEEVVKEHKPKIAILNFPGNPAGNEECEAILEDALEICNENNVGVISDEVYNRYVYEVKHVPIGKLSDNVITVDAPSKTFAMTGWRLGCAIAPNEEIAKNISKKQSDRTTCPNTAAQYGLIAAYENPEKSEEFIRQTVSEFRKRRDFLVRDLNCLKGVRCANPEGAFYAFPNIERTGMTSQQFTDLLVSEANVTTVPGSAFGNSGEGFTRFAYTTPIDKIAEASRRIKMAVESAS